MTNQHTHNSKATFTKTFNMKTIHRMKKIQFAMFTALIVMGTTCFSCKNQTTEVISHDADSLLTDSVGSETEMTYISAIDNYLVNEIGANYAKAKYCVPLLNIIDVDEQDAENILVWGDFWVFNYDQVGDTLKCISGGSHPGLMHIRQADSNFEVTTFDQVEDGARNLPSAKKIFGDKYDAFHAINSNAEERDNLRAKGLADYVKKHNLTATLYQDHGWPAKNLPL